jgi:hypothetical protein
MWLVVQVASEDLRQRHDQPRSAALSPGLTTLALTMIVAKIYPEPGKGGRGKKNALLSNGFNQGELSKARLVLKVLPQLAENPKTE